ncbi:sensor histidine kinase [Sphingobium subterraneum]|uniref:histidine kinase n=1 Tax=Sphingobium subterraneum TaxID=627688 RepID=A0A841J275_9SPHN|nr:HAMP domain-containing sensor histidine kinase [Sphingobium subterraneum]MBB6122638.1 signal transduction histidine kinase [Sphingobium subterraneum]
MTRPSAPGTLHAQIGVDGRILSADEGVLRLQAAAGGSPDGRLLVPQLAAIVRLAVRLRILIARPVVAGGDGYDVSMWVRARPSDDGVRMTLHDWREVPMRVTPPEVARARAADIALAADGWRWTTDSAMVFTLVEQSAEPGSPSAGMPFAAAFDLGDKEDGAIVLSRIAERRAFFGQIVRDVLRADCHYHISGHPVFDHQGAFGGYAGKALSVPAPAAADLVEPLDAASDQPVLGAIPDFGKRLDLALRQPLGRIIANAETISGQLEGPLRQDYAAYAADIAHAGKHLMELVDDLADLQAIDRPNFQVAREEIDLADIARRTAGLLSVKGLDRGISIEAPRNDESVPAVGEFRRVLQILVNLVGNAIRYSPEHSHIWIRTDVADDMAHVVVADQGRGIPIEDQERVFEKFERLGRDDVAGSGLGLYISRRLARAMGGDIRIDSAPGQGARFILSVPRV